MFPQAIRIQTYETHTQNENERDRDWERDAHVDFPISLWGKKYVGYVHDIRRNFLNKDSF